MELWYPLAHKDPIGTSGDFVDGFPARGVLHTTEGASYDGARQAYGTGKNPHFTATYEHGVFEIHQHTPIDQYAKALVHPSGGVDTNRAHAIQIEIVGTCDPSRAHEMLYVGDFPQAYLDGIAAWMRWVEEQTGVKPVAPETFEAYPASAGANNGVRFDEARWRTFDGWCGHQHVPGNDHGDPGALNLAHLLGQAPAPAPAPTPAPAHVGPWWYGRVLRSQKPLLHGEDVKYVQRHVGVPVDGFYGDGTAHAVAMFQRSHHLTPDGVVGPATATQLH